jgi:D-alanyl-lipoteichoic acid acyltransferase DltB (MBOAT superfamily)
MTLCGLWHGDRLSFAVWGLGHGALLACHQLHRQKVLARLPARKRMKLLSQPVYRGGATVLTFLCVSLLWVPFRFDLDQSVAVYGRLFSVFFHPAM